AVCRGAKAVRLRLALVLSERASDALGHFAGGFVREGERADLTLGDATLDEADDALGDDAGFSGASAGEDEERPELVLDGGLLRRIEGEAAHRVETIKKHVRAEEERLTGSPRMHARYAPSSHMKA